MTFRIDEAEKAATALRHRLANGEAAIKAMGWLTQPELQKHARMRITSEWGSAHDGNKQALDYINVELARHLPDIIAKAICQAQSDMDNYLGNRKAEI